MTRKPPRKPPDKCKAQSFAFRKSIPRMCANDPEHKTLASSSRMSDNDHPDTDTSNGDSVLGLLQNNENMPRVRLGCSFQLGLLQNNENMPRVRLGSSFRNSTKHSIHRNAPSAQIGYICKFLQNTASNQNAPSAQIGYICKFLHPHDNRGGIIASEGAQPSLVSSNLATPDHEIVPSAGR